MRTATRKRSASMIVTGPVPWGCGPYPKGDGDRPRPPGAAPRTTKKTRSLYNLGIGSYSIIAVYNGDDNFNGSQSSGSGDDRPGPNGFPFERFAACFGRLVASNSPQFPGSIGKNISVSEGYAARVSGTVSGLDGAGFAFWVVGTPAGATPTTAPKRSTSPREPPRSR